jgi:hypothetical protein
MTSKIILIVPAILFCLSAVEPAWAQFSLPKQSRAIFSGQLTDSKTGEPLSDVTVIIRSDYGDSQAKTDAAGNFLLEVSNEKELEKFLIVFSHPDYREKDMSALFNDTFRGKARLALQGEGKSSAAKVKYKKTDLSISCGSSAEADIKSGTINFGLDCQSGERTLSFSISRGNTFAVSASNDVEIEINEKKAKIVYARNEPVRIDIKAVMFKR